MRQEARMRSVVTGNGAQSAALAHKPDMHTQEKVYVVDWKLESTAEFK
jgi:hypothetical protein